MSKRLKNVMRAGDVDPFYLKPVQTPVFVIRFHLQKSLLGFDSFVIHVRQMKKQTWSLLCIK